MSTKLTNQLLTHLEFIQYTFFNGQQKWTTIKTDELKLYMAYIYFGTPNIEDGDGSDDIFNYYKSEDKDHILKIFKIVKENIIKSSKSIEVGVTFTHSICKSICKICGNFPINDIHQWCLFRIKLNDVETFIDPHQIRTYKDWNDYLKNNKLPEGIMIYPQLGYYDESKLLVYSPTSASNIISKTFSKLDKFGNSINFFSGVFLAGGLIFPALAPIMIPSTIMSLSSNAYSSVRAVGKITDLIQHNQSMSNPEGFSDIMNLLISSLGTATAFSNGIRVASEMYASQLILNSFEKSLSRLNAGACVLGCILEIVNLSVRIRNRNEITFHDFITLRLDLFVTIGLLWPTEQVRHMFEVFITGITTVYYTEIIRFPYKLHTIWFRSFQFAKRHITEFINQVTKFLMKNLTKKNILFAYNIYRKYIESYVEQRNSLNVNDLLKHIVDDTPLKCSEEVNVKQILCGPYMLELLHKLQIKIDHSLIIFCIDYIMKKANVIYLKFKTSLELINNVLNNLDLDEIKKEFCKQYELEDCCMSQYVLCSIKDTLDNINIFTDAYHTNISKSGYTKHLVRSDNIDSKSLSTYQVTVPSDNLDIDTCKRYTHGINENIQNLNNYQFIKADLNVSILFTIEGFTVKIIFFHVHQTNGIGSLNISIYQSSDFSIKPQIKF